jgi:thiamine biosynthesis lipoprotein
MSADLFRRPPTRREFLTLGTGVFVALAMPWSMRRSVPLVRRAMPLMGTIAEVQVAHRDAAVAARAIDAAFAELHRIERLMTRFRADSDIGRANLGAGTAGVAVSPETARVVRAALDWAAASEGRFDPALGAASELWNVLDRREPPPVDRVARLAGRHLWRQVDLADHRGAPQVRYGDESLHLDLGAIAKGYGIDRATAALRSSGIASGLVTVGGDLYALGSAPSGDPWQVGIRDPHRPDALAGQLTVRDRAVATSGDYERYFEWRGTRYHHLLDAETAAPRRTTLHSMTVLASSAMHADAAATATFGLDRAAAEVIARRMVPDAELIPLA